MQARNKKKFKKNVWSIIYALILIIITGVMIFPFLWMLSSAFKPELDVFEFPFRLIPHTFKLDNFTEVWKVMDFRRYYLNTIKIAVISTLLQLLTSSMAAYAFAKIKFPERDKLFMFYISALMIPFQVIMIPQFILMKNLNIEGHNALILISAFNPFGVFLMRQFFISIPEELSQAARIDGLGEFGIFLRIMLPLSKPAIASLVIYSFISMWNQFLQALIYINHSMDRTIQLAMRMFMTQYNTEYALIMAASVFAIVPVVVIFVSLQKYFIKGIATTGLKG